MYFVYILRSQKDDRRYVVLTDCILWRVEEHNRGKVTSTWSRRPFIIEYWEKNKNRDEARRREKYFKTAAGRRWLDQNVTTLKVKE